MDRMRLVAALIALALAACGGSGPSQANYSVPADPPAVDVSGTWTGIPVGAGRQVTMHLAQSGATVSGDCLFRYSSADPRPLASGKVGASTLGAACAAVSWSLENCGGGLAFTVEGEVEVAPAFNCANCSGRFTGVWRCGDASGQLVMYREP